MLAVITNHIWNPTETFVRRHAEDLLPGRVVVIALGYWEGAQTNLPVFLVEPQRGSLVDLAQRVARRLGAMRPQATNLPLNSLVRNRLKHFLIKYKVSAILGEFMDSALRFLPLAQELGIPFFVHAHGYDISLRLRDSYWRNRYTEYDGASGVIVMSQTVRNRLILIGLSPGKIHVIPYGVDVPQVPLSHRAGESIRLLAVGRMTGKKAPLLMLEAFRLALNAFPNLTFDFVGDGELLADAVRYVRAHQLEKKVVLHGYKKPTEIRQFMADADIFAQHSVVDPRTGDEEGLPVAILEAMSCALPVASTRHAGIPEAVIEGETGFLVPEGDTQGMARCIVHLAESQALRQSMGRLGWQRARDLFTWEQERNSLLKVIGLSSG